MVDFLVIGPMSAYAYMNIFHLIKDEKIMVGYNRESMYFDNNEIGVLCRWFSNISDYCPPPLEFKRQYRKEDFRKFDNLDIININRIEDIPSDYKDIMGVPLSFLDRWNRDQFEIIRLLNNGKDTMIDDKKKYVRLLIKRK